jgi:hypothetical protein
MLPRSAMRYLRQKCDGGCVQSGADVWRHGDVNGLPGMVNALIPILKTSRRKTVVAAYGVCPCDLR